MDENQEMTTVAETIPVDVEGSGKGQFTLNPEHHPAIIGLEQKENLVTNLYQQSHEKERLVETLKEENKFLKAKLKGFEALAYLYQQSKNECMSLKRLCAELNDEKEDYRKKCLLSDNVLHDIPVSHDIERNNIIVTDPFGILREMTKLHSDDVGCQTANLHDDSVAELMQNETFPLLGDEFCRKLEEPIFLKSGEFQQAVAMEHRTADDESQNGFSLLESQNSLLASSGDDCGNENQEKLQDLEICSDISGNNHELCCSRELSAFKHHLMNTKASKESKDFLRQLMYVGFKLISMEERGKTEEWALERGALLGESHGLRPMETSATQTLDQSLALGSNDCQSTEHGTTSEVDRLTCVASSSERRKSSIVTDDLITEVQILRQQVMTFKDDFERERRDREKVRSECDLLKWHFDRVSSDFRHLKDQLRSTEIKLEESEREKAALRHNISKTANELRKLKVRSTSASSITELGTQRVLPLEVHQQTWPCVHCTYLNPYQRQTCEMCGRHAAVHHSPLQVRQIKAAETWTKK